MDIGKYIKTVTNLNTYISFTSDLQNKRIGFKTPLNISTILSLKDLRSIEIEYFNKCEENGGATKIVEILLNSPPSKTWSLLGGQLISLLQYWLEAVRKHLIIHNTHWWTFLKLILKFIKVIRLKDVSLNKILLEETADCLLDLATHSVPDAKQRNDIIQIFNVISAATSRTIRMACKNKFQEYFIKLSTLLASAGDLPLQYTILEALLRWLLPRHELAVRRAAASNWFPEGVYSRRAVGIFLERPWQDFMKDARDFLNAQNESGELVTSVRCKALRVGKHVWLSDKHNCWLDLNFSTKCLSILLDPRWELWANGSHDYVLVGDENSSHVELKQDGQQVVITVAVLEVSRVYPFPSNIMGDDVSACDIHITVSSRTDLCQLDKSLRGIFGDKYKMSLDIEAVAMCMSPDDVSSSDVINATEEDARFSMPPEVPRRRHAGYITRSRKPTLWNSPSTVSTSSLAQLHEKLAALPRYTFEKEPVSVCALPQLSTVSEDSETDENHRNNSSLSTVSHRRYGICYKRINRTDSKTSHSTSDSNEKRNLSPVVNDDENSISCLLLATIGSADNSVISDTIGRLPKNTPCNTDNIVDLLAQEALESNLDRNEAAISPEIKKNFPDIQLTEKGLAEDFLNKQSSKYLQKNPLIAEQQPIDESSNEIVENTPFSWVQIKRPIYKGDIKSTSKKDGVHHEKIDGIELIHNVEAVEKFFSQHVTENRNGDLVISPTLARKINETSSECSEDLDQCLFREEHTYNLIEQDIMVYQLLIPDVDVVECVNAMVDKICEDLGKCAEYIDLVNEHKEVSINSRTKHPERKTTKNKITQQQNKHDSRKKVMDNVSTLKKKPNNSVVLKFSKTRSLSCKKTPKNINKLKKQQPFAVMSPITERENVTDDSLRENVESPMNLPNSIVTPSLIRRKRKLYSPNDEMRQGQTNSHISNCKEDTKINCELKTCSETPKSIATSYKELEQERQKRTTRSRLKLKKPVLPVSPKTLKMNQDFENLKKVTYGEPVKLADKKQLQNDDTVYNYTSDSDIEVEKRPHSKSILKNISSQATNVAKSAMTVKTSKKTNKAIKTIEVKDERNNKDVKRTRKPRTKQTIPQRSKENVSEIAEPAKSNLEDERMRAEAPEILNTSLVIDHPIKCTTPNKDPEPVLNIVPQMECIAEDNCQSDNTTMKDNKSKSRTKRTLSLKRNKEIPTVNLDVSMDDNDRTVSPLPCLVVETVLTTELDINDSVSGNLFQKFKDIYQGKQVADSEVNTTQNLLSDSNELINYSPTNLNVSKERNPENGKEHNKSQAKRLRKQKTAKKDVKKLNTGKMKIERKLGNAESHSNKSNVIQPSTPDTNSERSIPTIGNSRSPITAHGDLNEDPPNPTSLIENIQPRIVEQEYLNKSIKDFFAKLTEQLNRSNRSDAVESARSLKGDKAPDDRSSNNSNSITSPTVLISRLSPEYIRSQVNSSLANNSKTNVDVSSSPQTSKDDLNSAKEFDKISTKTAKGIPRKSIISPINLPGDFVNGNKNTLPLSGSDDNCVKRIKKIFSNKKSTPKQLHLTPAQTNKPAYSRKSQKHITTSSPISSKPSTEIKQNIRRIPEEESTSSRGLQKDQSIQEREESVDSRVSAGSSKASKRISSPILGYAKRVKYDEENNNFGSTITESGPSLSSVNEWFKRNEPSFTADSINLSMKENVKNVLEKLDTTLVEIHHNTSKRFINMFVDATKQLDDLKKTRGQLQRETAADIMSSVVKIVDDKFLELNQRMQSMDSQFMENLKKQAHNLIAEECKQKRAMVTLLKEDVQSVLDHIEKAKAMQ